MVRVEYPSDLDSLKKAYRALFSSKIQTLESEWTRLCRSYNFLPQQKTVQYLLTCGFPDLVDVYISYIVGYDAWTKTATKRKVANFNKAVKRCFDYVAHQGKIAQFFMSGSNGFQIHTCHYCETAYINAYDSPGGKRNHFDLDHVLDKGSCPIVALSLFNFVPSCPCCNEKLKRQKIIGAFDADKLALKPHRDSIIKLSPTHAAYDFDQNVKIGVAIGRPLHKTGYLSQPECYRIEFHVTDADYADSVKTFQLEERYNYHKALALRLLELKSEYTASTIEKMSMLLGRDVATIKNEIFGNEFCTDYHRTFAKLIRDLTT